MNWKTLRHKSREMYQKADERLDAWLDRGELDYKELAEINELKDAAHWVNVAAGQAWDAANADMLGDPISIDPSAGAVWS